MDEGSKETVTKSELLKEMLQRGKVMIHLDARRDGVDVPAEYGDDADLRLNLSYRFQYGDLEVGDSRVRATLSFSGRPHACIVPLDAVFAMISHVSGEGFLFPSDAPAEAIAGLAMMASPLAFEETDSNPEEGTRPRDAGDARPMLRAIEGGAGEIEEDVDDDRSSGEPDPVEEGPEADDEKDGDMIRRRHLRLVK